MGNSHRPLLRSGNTTFEFRYPDDKFGVSAAEQREEVRTETVSGESPRPSRFGGMSPGSNVGGETAKSLLGSKADARVPIQTGTRA